MEIMEKSEKNAMFEKYCRMIQKKAWEVSKSNHCDYKEVEAQGFLLYCEALETWDFEKSSFSTHLFYKLMQLGSHPKYDIGYQRGRPVEELSEIQQNKLESRYESPSLLNDLESARENLSIKSYNIIKWILERTWETDSVHKPSISLAVRVFNLPRKEIEKSWLEIKNFWQLEGNSLFA